VRRLAGSARMDHRAGDALESSKIAGNLSTKRV
jgi:hypothetical protein